MTAPVWLVTGAQASGKSTIAELLASQFERGVHVRGGQFYRWAVRGWVHFDDKARADEARRLLDLRYRLLATVADEYASAGFTTVAQDNIYSDDVARWLDAVRARSVHLVVLRPSIEAVTARHEDRRLRTGKVAYPADGSYTPADNDADIATIPAGLGLWLDSSSHTPDETLAEILSRAGEAVVRS